MRMSVWSSDVCSSDLEWLILQARDLGLEIGDPPRVPTLFLGRRPTRGGGTFGRGAGCGLVDRLREVLIRVVLRHNVFLRGITSAAQPPDHLCRIVPNRNDPDIVQTGWPDHPNQPAPLSLF